MGSSVWYAAFYGQTWKAKLEECFMNNNRLGCLSPSAIVASIITLLIIAASGLFSGSGFLTAGSLNARAIAGSGCRR